MSVWYQSSVFITPAAGDTVIPTTKGKFPKFLHTWTAINTSDQVIQAGAFPSTRAAYDRVRNCFIVGASPSEL